MTDGLVETKLDVGPIYLFLVHLLGVALWILCILCVYRMLSSFTMHIVYVMMHTLCYSLVLMMHD